MMRVIKLPILGLIIISVLFAIVALKLAAPAFSQVVMKTITPDHVNPGDEVQITITVPGDTIKLRSPADTILVMDETGSMFSGSWCEDTFPCPSSQQVPKIDSAQIALKKFINQTQEDQGLTQPGDYVGFVPYAGSPCNPTIVCGHLNFPIANMTGVNKVAIKDDCGPLGCGIDNLLNGGSTAMGAGLDTANRELLNQIDGSDASGHSIPSSSRAGVNKFIVLASDGIQNTQPSPFENNILQTSINNHFTIFTVGIGDDVTTEYSFNEATGKYINGPNGTPSGDNTCTGCKDSDKDGSLTGEDILKYIACDTDQNRPNPADNCRMSWNTSNLCDLTNPNSVNDLDCPKHYFYARGERKLSQVYTDIAKEISMDVWFDVYEKLNLTDLTTGLPVSVFDPTFTGLQAKDCATEALWPITSTLPGDNFINLLLGPVPAGKTVCITFNATVSGSAPEGTYNVDDPSSVVVNWDPAKTCDLDHNGRINGDLELNCLNQELGKRPSAPLPAKVHIINPIKPWLQTKGGDVGVQGNIVVQRDLNSSVTGLYNSDYLNILTGAVINKPFTSAKGWLVQNYSTIKIYPDPGTSMDMYHTLYDKYSKQCTRTPVDGTPAEVAIAAAICPVLTYAGNLTISGSTGYYLGYTGDPAIIFVAGDLAVNQRVIIGPSTGLIFVVSGNITVGEDLTFEPDLVRRMDGIYITNGEFNSGGASCGSNATNSNEPPLQINGAVYAFDQACFTRSRTSALNLNNPAEVINFEPKYLWLFRNIIGDTKVVYREVAP